MEKNSSFGIDVGRFPEALETEEVPKDTLRFKQFEHHDYKEYGPRHKYKNFDVEFLSSGDESYTELTDHGVKEAPLDNFDGKLTTDQVSFQENMFEHTPYSAYDLKDYSDLYDQYEFSVIAKKAYRIKIADIIPGDTVLLMRPQRYLLSYGKKDRIARVLDTQENGWLLIETLGGEKLAVYAGSSDEDDDVQKLDFNQLEEVYKYKLGFS